MKRARVREADRLKRLLAAAEKDRATRYAAATRGAPAEVLGTVTELQAEAHLRAVAAGDLAEVALPGDLPLPAQMPASWTAPNREAAAAPADDDNEGTTPLR